MADDQSSAPSDDLNEASEKKTESRDGAERTEAEVIPPEAEEAIRKAMEAGPKALLSVFGAFSRNTGPDPQTIKVLAEVEKHAEDSRLKGYQATLANRDKQAERDHIFRTKSLNHASLKSGTILVVAVAGVVTGLYLSVSGSRDIGGYILLASFMAIWQILGEKMPLGGG